MVPSYKFYLKDGVFKYNCALLSSFLKISVKDMKKIYITPQTEIIKAYGDDVLAPFSTTPNDNTPSKDNTNNQFAPSYDFEDEGYGQV